MDINSEEKQTLINSIYALAHVLDALGRAGQKGEMLDEIVVKIRDLVKKL